MPFYHNAPSSYASSQGTSRSPSRAPAPAMKPKRRPKDQTPQEAIDEFWAKFTSKTPGKATTIIPQNPWTKKAIRRNAVNSSSDVSLQSSYETAAAMCRAKVEKIVEECRRINKKYRDLHFDIESDLKLQYRDTLESLCNTEDGKLRGSEFRPLSAKRVPDIFDRPHFYIDGPTANDVRQGRDGDCWLMAALCTLSNKKGLIEKLCVKRDEKVGVYGFVFYRDGEWISEIVDDFLFLTKSDYDDGYIERALLDENERRNPEEAYRKIYQSNSNSLYFAQCQHPQETWLPLLEKAYAKAHGDYAAIDGGFGGEGIEDLTGGVTSELYTTDILDKDHFWEELLKVNEDFLFGCSTGVWGTGVGERKGIIELHAYSIQRAVEIDGHRLLRLKNPWGKGEWKGPWSDGSKEWTPEWLAKLGHRFGDDGDFWIAYDDLLRKYQAFERTRLFDQDWRVNSIWTTVDVPWKLDYHDTRFCFSLSKKASVVIVLAQLDDRYFRGLEGQYRFVLSFRLHKAGHEDYLVRSEMPYRMMRSVNVELDLEKGEYEVRVRLDTTRFEHILPVDQVLRRNVKSRREKMIRVGLAYDLAHSKGVIEETEEEKAAKVRKEQKEKEKQRQEIREKLLTNREETHYLRTKQFLRQQAKEQRQKAKEKKKRAERKARQEGRRRHRGNGVGAQPEEEDPHSDKEQDVAKKEDVTDPQEEKVVDKTEATSEKDMVTDDKAEVTTEEEKGKAVVENGTKSEGVSAKENDGAPVEKDAAFEVVVTKANGAVEDPESAAEQHSDGFCESEESDSEPESYGALSDVSDREIELQIDSLIPAKQSTPAQAPVPNEEPDEFELSPWNAVAVIGLRLYHKVDESQADPAKVRLRVVRSNPYLDSDEEEAKEDKEEEEKTGGLDVDDAAKDATLVGGAGERRRSIVGDGENRLA